MTEPQDLVGNEDNRFATVLAGVYCSAFGDRDVKFWLIICGEGRDVAIFTGEFQEFPIRTSTNCVSMVVNFVRGNMPRVSFLRVRLFGAGASRT